MSPRPWKLLLSISNLLIPIAIFVFATGFFPHKPFIAGKASFDGIDQDVGQVPAPFDKVVLMMVDALRRCNLSSSIEMLSSPNTATSYTPTRLVLTSPKGPQFKISPWYYANSPCSLIRSGAAMPFTAHATSPTITMPRVKAITTGSIPSFLDVIMNFAESDTTLSLANQDTWLSQLKDKPWGNLIMYGDDTWLKLFPDTFSRADGTSSFFVSVSSVLIKRCTLVLAVLRQHIRISPKWTIT